MKGRIFLLTELIAMAAMLLVTLVGCGGGGGGGGGGTKGGDLPPAKPINGSVQINVNANAVAEATAVKITISGIDIQPIINTLTIDPVTRIVTKKIYVLAGDRVIKAEALDTTNTVIGTGQTSVKIVAGESVKASITLNGNQANISLQTGLPDVQITVANLGINEPLKGNVTGNTAGLGIVVYIKVGEKWFTRPYYGDMYLTTISSNGNWECNITPFLTDYKATEVLVFLVNPKTATIPILAGSEEKPVIPEALAYAGYVK